jgi:hypothetical protein
MHGSVLPGGVPDEFAPLAIRLILVGLLLAELVHQIIFVGRMIEIGRNIAFTRIKA